MPRIEQQSMKRKTKPALRKRSPTEDIRDLIRPAREVLKESVSLLLYGKSGTGKTTVWASFPGPILALVCSGSYKKKGELRSLTDEQLDKTEAIRIDTTQRFKEVLGLQIEEARYTTIVLDHVSGLQDLVLKEVLDLDEVPQSKSWGLATQEEYGIVTTQCKQMLRVLLDLDCNVVIIGHERFDKPEATDARYEGIQTPSIGVELMPKLATWLNGSVDYAGQMFIRPLMKEVVRPSKRKGKPPRKRMVRVPDKVQFCLRCQRHDVFYTKFRKPKEVDLPDVIVDPDYDKILEVIDRR